MSDVQAPLAFLGLMMFLMPALLTLAAVGVWGLWYVGRAIIWTISSPRRR